MPRTPRRRLAEGVYVDRYSLTGVVKVGDRTREQAFPPDTPVKEIQHWRERERVRLRDQMPEDRRGTFAHDAAAYLARCEKRPASLPAKRSELKAWGAALKNIPRHRVTPTHIDQAIAAWQRAGTSPKTILNRCRTLRHLYTTLANDKRARTPLDTIDLPRPPARLPVGIDPQVIVAVEEVLRAGDAKDHARFMVMAATGIRPSQLMRLTAADVDLERGLVVIAAGKGGRPIVHVLNGDMLAAWRTFVAAKAWGQFDTSALAVACRRAGWPPGVRVYNAKHAIGMELARQGADMADIQAWFGHTSTKTTAIYTGVPVERMARLSAALDGRLGWARRAPAAAPPDAPSAGRTSPHEAALHRMRPQFPAGF
ncbi:MAG: tyrosine-type recombinase/integrase [Vicinamibacterales bacterium]